MSDTNQEISNFRKFLQFLECLYYSIYLHNMT